MEKGEFCYYFLVSLIDEAIHMPLRVISIICTEALKILSNKVMENPGLPIPRDICACPPSSQGLKVGQYAQTLLGRLFGYPFKDDMVFAANRPMHRCDVEKHSFGDTHSEYSQPVDFFFGNVT